MKQVVLVNGVPASGKSTVCRRLVVALARLDIAAVPLSLDAIKEALYAHVGIGDRDHNRMLGRASYQAIFSSIAGFPEPLIPVVDAWHGFLPREALQENLQRAGIERVIELWCAVSPQTAASRYRKRSSERHPGHLPASYADELLELASHAQPLRMGELVVLDTETGDIQTGLDDVLRLVRAGQRDVAE